jgi:hypothetical protein
VIGGSDCNTAVFVLRVPHSVFGIGFAPSIPPGDAFSRTINASVSVSVRALFFNAKVSALHSSPSLLSTLGDVSAPSYFNME